MIIYIIGIPENGGCWFSSSQAAFSKYEDALKYKTERVDQPYLKVFTISVKD